MPGASMDATHDRRANVTSIRLRDGKPKHVIAGRETLVIFSDDKKIWYTDLEAES